MRLLTFALVVLFVAPTWQAQAAESDDWCKKATLPSSIVICGDPGLRMLADERQRAFDEAKARVGEEGAKALLEVRIPVIVIGHSSRR
jgi:hypothetical protein